MPDDGPQHSGGMTGSLKAARAAVVLIVFAVAVAVLVAVGTRPTTTPSSAQTTTTTTVAGGSTTTVAGGSTTSTTAHGAAASTTTTTSHHGHGATTTTVARSTVSVVVANATNTNGLAAHYSQVIGNAGWKVGTPIDASTTEATSAVYYASGQQQAAAEIATSIGVKPTQVLPLTTAVPVSGATGNDVVVVIGADLASAGAGS